MSTKRQFKVKITETLERVVAVEAANEDDAVQLVQERYDSGDIVLDSEDFSFEQIDVTADPLSIRSDNEETITDEDDEDELDEEED